MTELHYVSLIEVCRRVKSGELSSVQVTEHVLNRIESLDGDLKSYAMVLPEQALATAARLDGDRREGKPLGALHGVPVAVKDLLNTQGLATASGTRVMSDFVPDADATVVTRLRQAGAVIVGKTQLTEGAFGAHHPDIDPPKNPWNVAHWPGVSSSGSGVSVAAGLAYGALGTDTGGSIRFPSACCGLVGIKPTYGRVSKSGAFPLAESLDHIGPMTRSVADAARLLQVLAGYDPADPVSLAEAVPDYAAALAGGVSGLTIGVDWAYVGTGVEDVVEATIRGAVAILGELGVVVREIVMPGSYRSLVQGWSLTCGVECARAHRAYYPARKDEYGDALAGLIQLGMNTSEEEYQRLEGVRAQFTAELDQVLDQVDAVIAPCMPSLPPRLAEMGDSSGGEDERVDLITFTAPFDYSGHPTITLPVALADNGLPKAFQLIGRRLGEPTLIQLGSAFERVANFDQHPLP